MANNSKSFSLHSTALNVSDIQILSSFYQDFLGLKLLSSAPHTIRLGYANKLILTLHERKDLSKGLSGDAGLYHIALRYANQTDLAQILKALLSKKPHLFSGGADHLVSEAFYFSDPEGNGIELYFDRDTTLWQWDNHRIKMSSLHLDPKSYISKYADDKDYSNPPEDLGHIHIKVGEVSQAKKFYVDILGFDITAELPGALFISHNGYHHHLGLNSWESFGAGKRKESLGLHSITLQYKDSNELHEFKKTLLQNSINFHDETNELTFEDPWLNKIVVRG